VVLTRAQAAMKRRRDGGKEWQLLELVTRAKEGVKGKGAVRAWGYHSIL
jgi:hypothetical protein